MKLMIGPTYVTAADLARWATLSRDAQGALPHLIRRLVHATTVVQRIGFPAGDSIARPGWDGIVVSENGSAFVPKGISAWEMGTTKTPKTKANEDYDKRTLNPADIDPTNSTFVFVTPHPWLDKDEWIAEKKAEGRWADIVVLDGDDVEEWLELAPAVHVWFSILTGKHPAGAEDLSSYWSSFAAVTNPPTTSDMMLAGRSDEAKNIRDACTRTKSSQTVLAETREEAIAVIAASAYALDEEERIELLARALIVRDEQSFREVMRFPPPLILIVVGQRAELVAKAVEGGHVVFLALDRADATEDTRAVPRLDPDKMEEALKTAGIPRERARELALTARRSFAAFRRQISPFADVQRPPWADPLVGPSLVPILLAGEWGIARRKSDQDAVGQLDLGGYAHVQEVVVRWSEQADPPVRRVGDVWYVLSRDDMWTQLRRFITPDDVERFRTLATDVLGRLDPKFDLPPGEQWTAAVTGHVLPHSHHLRDGLAEMVALFGARGDDVVLGGGVTAANVAERIVHDLLNDVPWQRWASLQSVLPLFAEAAPDAFLTAVERGVTGTNPVLKHLFMDKEDAMFSPTPHTGLLWALEGLARAPEYLPRVSLALGALARLDTPRGKLGNRPDASLVQIYRLWFPQTSAPLDERLATLSILLDREPDVGWNVLTSLLPHAFGDHADYSHRPRWRDWGPTPTNEINTVEVMEGSERIAALLLAKVTAAPERWPQLVSVFSRLPANVQQDLLAVLEALDPVTLDRANRLALWTSIRTLVSEHRSWADRRRKGNKGIEALAVQLSRLTPDNPEDAAAWLFERRVLLPEGREKDYTQHAKIVDARRTEAVRTVIDLNGIAGVLALAARVDAPEAVGSGLARAGVLEDEAADALLHDHLDESTSAGELAAGYAAVRAQDGQWLDRQRAREDWTASQRARLLLLMPVKTSTWEAVAKEPPDVQRPYWKRMWMYGIEEPEVEFVAERFLEHGRPFGAVQLLGDHLRRKHPLLPDLLLRAMEAALRATEEDDQPDRSTFGYTAAEILTTLESADVDQSRVATVEWALLPALGHHVRSPKILHSELGRNPAFFIEVLSYLYRRSDEEPREEATDEERALAKHAWHLLDTWHLVPGTRPDGTIDSSLLNTWVNDARGRAIEAARGPIADDQIGKMLIGAASEGDLWPPPAVCELIERLKSDALDAGFQSGVMNSRGVHSKDPREGGIQEVALAEKYEAHAERIRGRWPHVATILTRIGKDYRHQARRGDDEAELRTDGVE